MRISDWSSYVCSSDLRVDRFHKRDVAPGEAVCVMRDQQYLHPVPQIRPFGMVVRLFSKHRDPGHEPDGDWKSVVSGKSVYVRVDLGGRSFIKKPNYTNTIIINVTDYHIHNNQN